MKRLSLTSLAAVGLLVCNSVLAEEVSPKPVAVTKLHRIVAQSPAELRELFHYTGEPLPLVSAHRGGAGPGFPENCIETFEHTLAQTFSMLEIDPRLTKNGEVVVHHDATLERTTTGRGKLADKTLAELKQLRLKDAAGNVTDYRIPTLDEVLVWARGKTILVLDQKDVPLQMRIDKVREHHAESYVMLIVGSLKEVQACYAKNQDLMMEVMIPDHEKVSTFDASGVPWTNVIAFVGHVPPEDVTLYEAIHAKGACCMIGTSRNLDRQFAERAPVERSRLESDYRELLGRGADVIETDLPRELGQLLFENASVPDDKQRFFFIR